MNYDLSIIIPLYNEEDSLPELCTWIHEVCSQKGYSYEVIMINDGSTDNSWQVIQNLATQFPVKGIKFQRNYGKSAALNEGFKAALGKVVITMDADLQDSPDEIPGLYEMIVTEGYDLVSGWKQKRFDNKLTKNIPSKLFNAVTRGMSGIQLNDFNCGLKAYRKKVIKSIEVFGEMHRYIPVLAKWAGFRKIGERVVQHRARKYGTTKFGWERFVNGFLDLLTIQFISKFGKRPMHFFGLIGSLMFLVGFFSIAVLIVSKFASIDYGLTNKPLFYIALSTMIMGTQFFLAGYMGELITRNAAERNVYLIDEKIGL